MGASQCQADQRVGAGGLENCMQRRRPAALDSGTALIPHSRPWVPDKLHTCSACCLPAPMRIPRPFHSAGNRQGHRVHAVQRQRAHVTHKHALTLSPLKAMPE
jgi:hypothetical protein